MSTTNKTMASELMYRTNRRTFHSYLGAARDVPPTPSVSNGDEEAYGAAKRTRPGDYGAAP
jgi:hypothetical protein